MEQVGVNNFAEVQNTHSKHIHIYNIIVNKKT